MSFKHVFSFAVILLIQATVDAANIKTNNIADKVDAKVDVVPPGPVGAKGEPGSDRLNLTTISNWKQCVWQTYDDKGNGLIKSCNFNKNYDDTSLRVFYGGNLGIRNCNSCCKRWYFTFNGAECSKPTAIDGVLYIWIGFGTQDVSRQHHIEGYCNQVPKGSVEVGFWIGNCESYGNVSASTGWNSVSRIAIEEVPQPRN